MLENPDYHKKKQASEKQFQRAEKLIDPDGFIEKRASEKHQKRAEKMKIDPAGFRETKSAGQKQ